MKPYMLILIVAAAFTWSCNDDLKVDEKKLDKAGKELQETVQEGVDTIGSKLKKLKNKLDDDHKSR